MNLLHLLICAVIPFLPTESQALSPRQRYGRGDHARYLSNFFHTFNDIYSKINANELVRSLIGSFLKNEFEDRDDFNPISFTDSQKGDESYSGPGGDDKMPSQTKIAECLLSDDENFLDVDQKFYMPLRDASAFAKNFERSLEMLASSDPAFKVLNVAGNDSDSGPQLKLKIKCSAVSADSVSGPCTACIYFEEVVSKRHIRFGHVVDCPVMECMNGYDKKLAKGPTKGYFFLEFQKFHPICIA